MVSRVKTVKMEDGSIVEFSALRLTILIIFRTCLRASLNKSQ